MTKLRPLEQQLVEDALEMGGGYVLDFSDRTFGQFFDAEFGIDINESKYHANGSSKGKRMRTFIQLENDMLVAKVLRSLWEYRAAMLFRRGVEEDEKITENYFNLIYKLEGSSETANTDAIEKFEENASLDELILAINRDIAANKPQAALDRLHTYCMKRFKNLLALRGYACEDEEPLHSRTGKYVKALESEKKLQSMSIKIIKMSISLFEEFNHIRNDRTFAHDNEILGLHEARFIFDAVTNVLRYIRSLEIKSLRE